MKLISILTVAALSFSAQAEIWTCDFDAKVSGWLAALGGGGKVLVGDGRLSCENEDGEKIEKDLDVSLVGFVKGIGIARIKNITIKGVGIGINAIDDFTGRFGGVAGAEAGLLDRGAGVSVSFGVTNGNIGFDAEFSELDIRGAFAGVSISAISITDPEDSSNEDSADDEDPFAGDN